MRRCKMFDGRWMMFLLFVVGCSMFNAHCSMVFAQNDAMYIYRNDGEFNAFLKSDIDSIAQSHYDADSVYHADWQMQVVYTQDSIYRIPLAAIDSVSFIAPETILNEKVFELTSAHDPYLSDCDTIRFTLSLSTPAEMCPSKGNIVVSTYDCLSFPDGIMARVISKTQDGAGIHYNCEKVGLEDVYEQLIFIGECYVKDPQASSRRKAEVTYEREIWNKSWTKTLEKGGTTTTLDIGDVARMKVTVNIQIGKPMYFRLDLQNDLTSSIKFNATSSFEKYYEKELVKKVTLGRIPIPGTLLFITPKLGLSGYFAEGATVSLDCSAHFNRTDKVSFVLQNKKWSTYLTPKNDAGVDVASLSMTGYMEVGLIPDLLFSLCGSATGLGLECMVGVKESVDFKFDAVAAFDEGMYSALKDSYARTTVPWSARAYVQLGLFGDGIQPASVKLSGEPQIGTDKYLLPAFTELEYQKGANEKTAVLKTQPSRDLLLPVQLGMSFYEKDEKLEAKYLSTTYRNEKQWSLDGVQVAYSNMEAGKTYTAYPTVKIMGKELRAEPSKDFPELLTCPDDHHPHAIDLGLPSGTKWCCCNVGASTPEGYGGYYAWGETSEKSVYDWNTYAYGYYDSQGYYAYTNIGSDIAGTGYDVAHVRMGAPWRMPSHEQQIELMNNCSHQWTQKNGVNGILVTGRNGGQVFLPAAGYRWGDELYDAGAYGDYWSSSLDPLYDYDAYYMYFGSGYWNWRSSYRRYGLSVRAVRP
ncbi:MAG: hypothetical protein J6W52_07670 [Bacteroidaceae bacterium]|nr:hypothetical protein [Bacteroidaceae bacterium]